MDNYPKCLICKREMQLITRWKNCGQTISQWRCEVGQKLHEGMLLEMDHMVEVICESELEVTEITAGLPESP